MVIPSPPNTLFFLDRKDHFFLPLPFPPSCLLSFLSSFLFPLSNNLLPLSEGIMISSNLQSLRAKSGPSPAFIDTLWPACSLAPLFMHCLWLLSHYPSSCNRVRLTYRAQNTTLCPDLETVTLSEISQRKINII